TGALTMLAFSLGTLPALLSLSAMSSFATGALQRRFLTFAGAAVIVLGILNIQYGLVLASSSMASSSFTSAAPVAPVATETRLQQRQTAEAPTSEPKQIAVMRIVGFDYIPNRFTVTQGVPVEWRIDASEAAGCGRILIAPRLGIRKLLSSNSTTM